MEPIRVGEIHPLENSLVLERIFKYSNARDLKTCRQVCKLWEESTLEAFRESFRVVILCKDDDGNLCNFLGLIEGRGSFKTPFASAFRIIAETPPLDIDFQRFWKVCGNHIKCLELIHVNFEFADTFREAIFKACPLLQELKLLGPRVFGQRRKPFTELGYQDFVEEPVEWTPPQYPPNPNLKMLTTDSRRVVSWMEMFSNFLAIKTLALEGYWTEQSYENLFKSFQRIRLLDPQHLNLSHLEFSFKYLWRPMDIVPILVDGHISLKVLKILVTRNSQHVNALREILYGHAIHLESLGLIGENADWLKIFPIPGNRKLEHLQELELKYPIFKSMHFLEYIPNLRKLVLINQPISMLRNTDINAVVLERCTQLEIRDMMEILEIEDLNKISHWLPNLETLWINEVNNNLFGGICEYLPNLRNLHVRGRKDLDDCGITGMDEEDVSRINKEGGTGSWKPITCARPNIASLKSLESISLQGDFKLGYCAAKCGIQQASQLKCLRAEISCVNNETRRFLQSSIPWIDHY